MPTQDDATAAYARFGQWCSYWLQLRENLDRAERLLPLAQTPGARTLQENVIATCRKHIAELEALFPDAKSPSA